MFSNIIPVGLTDVVWWKPTSTCGVFSWASDEIAKTQGRFERFGGQGAVKALWKTWAFGTWNFLEKRIKDPVVFEDFGHLFWTVSDSQPYFHGVSIWGCQGKQEATADRCNTWCWFSWTWPNLPPWNVWRKMGETPEVVPKNSDWAKHFSGLKNTMMADWQTPNDPQWIR